MIVTGYGAGGIVRALAIMWLEGMTPLSHCDYVVALNVQFVYFR